jgi:tetratricopeptide (TPR) repeat protein
MAAHLGPDAVPKSLFEVLVDPPTAVGRKHLADPLNALARSSLATVNDGSVSVHRLLQKTVRDATAARGDQTAALRARRFGREPLSAARDRLLGAEHRDTLRTRHSLAFAYLWAVRAEEAIAIFEPLLADRERAARCRAPQYAAARHNLVRAKLDAERVGEAIAIFEPLLADDERILGARASRHAGRPPTLAFAQRAAGRVGEAIGIAKPPVASPPRSS